MSPPQRSRPAGTGRPRSESLAGGLDTLENTPATGGLAAIARQRHVNNVLRPRYDRSRQRSAPCDTGVGSWPWLVNADPRHGPVDYFAYLLHDDAVSIDNRLAAVDLFADRWGDAELVQALRAAHRLAVLHPRLAMLLRRLTVAGQR